jgi:hypothetical protein
MAKQFRKSNPVLKDALLGEYFLPLNINTNVFLCFIGKQ